VKYQKNVVTVEKTDEVFEMSDNIEPWTATKRIIIIIIINVLN